VACPLGSVGPGHISRFAQRTHQSAPNAPARTVAIAAIFLPLLMVLQLTPLMRLYTKMKARTKTSNAKTPASSLPLTLISKEGTLFLTAP
jgi:hypothetical protein